MPQKTITKICRYANERGYKHLSLEKQNNKLICRYNENDHWQLPADAEEQIIAVFRAILEAQENEYIRNKRFKILDGSNVISGRASITPAKNGDKISISLSSTRAKIKRFSGLGLNRAQQQKIQTALNKKTGLIILSAPEEQGLTTTYYSILSLIDSHRALYSIEDYPQYSLSNLNTIKAKSYGGVSSSLQLLSRLDSDVIACDAKLNKEDLKSLWRISASRLVIVALPYTSAAQSLKALRQAGISSAGIAERLLLITCQQLFPRLCLHCLTKLSTDIELKKNITKKWPLASHYWPRQTYINRICNKCRKNPKTEKIAVFEIMDFDKQGKLAKDYKPLILEALKKAELGIISLEEISYLSEKK